MASASRSATLRAGAACQRCRRGKTRCVYENGQPPCKNCAKGMHECYLPSEVMASSHTGSPARSLHRPRDSLPDRGLGAAAADRTSAASSLGLPRSAANNNEKLTPEVIADCERVITKTLPASVAFHKPSFLQRLKSVELEPIVVNALLTIAARSSSNLIRRYGGNSGSQQAAEHFAAKAVTLLMPALDQPSLADIQALCLLVIHEWGSRNAVRAYIYLGQAARMTQMFRIVHSPLRQADPEQFLAAESFRRTLWLIYILDCFLTSSPGRHPALSSHDVVDVALPCLDMNYHFGSPVYVRTINGTAPPAIPDISTPLSDVGEFGYIVLATKAWRNVVEMITTTTLQSFSEEQCLALEQDLEDIRRSLPLHFADKPGQIGLHITMGSGLTFAMIHSLLHCASIFINRRRILQLVTTEGFSMDAWPLTPHAHLHSDQIFAACHSIIQLMLALKRDGDPDSYTCVPVFMLFAAFEAGSTVAYLDLKGMLPANVRETAASIVQDAYQMMLDGSEIWTLVVPWQRHLSVMAKTLRDISDVARRRSDGSREYSKPPRGRSPPNFENVDTPVGSDAGPAEHDRRQNGDLAMEHVMELKESSFPDANAPRRPGIATINGGSVGVSTPATNSPGPVLEPKAESPDRPPSVTAMGLDTTHAAASAGGMDVDMTAAELCNAFERQLLELDDLAAFMGGGV